MGVSDGKVWATPAGYVPTARRMVRLMARLQAAVAGPGLGPTGAPGPA